MSMMKTTLVILSLFIFSIVNAQLSEGGTPQGFNSQGFKSSEEISSKNLRRINIARQKRIDNRRGIQNRYSIYKKVTWDIKKLGTQQKVENGTLWHFKIQSKNALSVGIIFEDFQIPDKAKLFIYSSNMKIIKGAFTSKNNKPHRTFSIAEIPSKEIIIEYFEPTGVDFPGTVIIGKIGQSYKDVFNTSETNSNDIDINCPEGDDLQLEKHSVAKMTYEKDGGGYLCSGALINNTNNDGTPFFLTAYHCLSTDPAASTLVTYFNYEKDDCNGTTIQGQTLSGSVVKAKNEESDVTLLLLDETPPVSYKPYYAGWNVEDDSILYTGSGIHHPAGRVKKVSLSNDSIYNYPYEINWDNSVITPPNTHWVLIFNKGFTEGGSSGSPLFDINKRIVGQLHGGGDVYNFYGKLSVSWSNGNFDFEKLQPFLDPDNTGIEIFDGYYPDTNHVAAHFVTDFQNVCKDAPIEFENRSVFAPTAWQWSFTPSSVTYHDGTNENSENPVVSFGENNEYTVSLEASNSYSSHIKTRSFYISSDENITHGILSLQIDTICNSSFDSVKLVGFNARAYEWSVIEGAENVLIDSSTINSDTLIIHKNPAVQIDSNYTIKIQLAGMHGECSDTVTHDIIILFPFNDNIANAHQIEIGDNGYFINNCATVEENEPHPPIGNCNTQSTWCDCNVKETILDNSIWFTFDGPASGIAAVDALGFDNQIAIYDANSAEDILSGDETKYTILAANDDFYPEDQYYASRIEEVIVTPGKKYWLQLDGSACGAEGSTNLILYDHTLKDTTTSINEIENNISIYPNPAKDNIIISGIPGNPEQIQLISIDGRIVLSNINHYKVGNDQIKVDLPVKEGIYFIQFYFNDKMIAKKLSIVN